MRLNGQISTTAAIGVSITTMASIALLATPATAATQATTKAATTTSATAKTPCTTISGRLSPTHRVAAYPVRLTSKSTSTTVAATGTCRALTATLSQNGHVVATKTGNGTVSFVGRTLVGNAQLRVSSPNCTSRFTVKVSPATVAGQVTTASTRRWTPRPTPKPATTTTTPAPVPTTTTSTPAPVPTTTTTTPAPVPTTTTTTPATPTYSVLSFGAVGNGVADDTAAIQKALNSLKAGDTLVFPAGYTFTHSAVLNAMVSGTRLTGGAVILATREAASAFHLGGNDMTVDNLTFRMGTTTQRWGTFEQMKLRVGWGTSNITISNVTIDGSAAAGLYIGGVTGFAVTDVTVQNTRADAIHMTGGSSNGTVVRPIVRNPGDDGVAIVSYKNDGAVSHNITVTSPRLYGQKWGRAFTVVGGTDITETDVYSDSSNAAAIYVAAESSYNTYGNTRVTFDGGTLVNSNTNATVDHGAVMVYSDQAADTPNTDVTVKNLTIKDTRLTASRQVGVIQYGAAVQTRLTFSNITIVGGNKWLFGTNAPATSINRSGWTWNGVAVANVLGW